MNLIIHMSNILYKRNSNINIVCVRERHHKFSNPLFHIKILDVKAKAIAKLGTSIIGCFLSLAHGIFYAKVDADINVFKHLSSPFVING